MTMFSVAHKNTEPVKYPNEDEDEEEEESNKTASEKFFLFSK